MKIPPQVNFEYRQEVHFRIYRPRFTRKNKDHAKSWDLEVS